MRIGFSRKEGSILSSIIQKATASRWSHCFLVDEDGVIMEASAIGGVKYGNIKNLYNTRGVQYELWDLVGTSSDLAVIDKYAGKQYGYIQILANFFARIFRSTWLFYTKSLVCSELVTLWLQQSRYARNFKDMKPNYVSPEDVYRKVTAHPRAKMEERHENR